MDIISHHLELDSYSVEVKCLSPNLWTTEIIKHIPETGDSCEAFPYWWNLAVFPNLPAGTISLWSQGELVPIQGTWGIFLPARSILNWRLGINPFQVKMISSTSPPPKEFANRSFAFEWNNEFPTNEADSLQILQQTKNSISMNFSEQISPVARKLKIFIDGNFMKDLHIADIARQLKFSRSVMTRLFNRSYGTSPVEYRNKLRISQAMLHLMFSNKTMSEIAQEVGFTSANSFQKRFRKFILAAPNKYQFSRHSKLWHSDYPRLNLPERHSYYH